ncbi:hypothetical protein [Erwinia sp. 198]|uniref:hypothetical protein n=1 Tax=Erwinia sp. 198 TaxID=2022746 RepID=UPI000F66A83C|nr:hypothetical protein [Erwinia sp. 198]
MVELHGKNSDSGQKKPLRLWLSEKYLRYAASLQKISVPGLASSATGQSGMARRKPAQKIRAASATYRAHWLEHKHSLRNQLRQIRRWIVSADLARKKLDKVTMLESAPVKGSRQSGECLDELRNETAGQAGILAAAKLGRHNGRYRVRSPGHRKRWFTRISCRDRR